MLLLRKNNSGFTIVELLIVIVVIAILAAISVVAYNGIQTRANNTARINGAAQAAKTLKAYVATYGTYPSTSSGLCLTRDNVCTNYTGVTITSSNSALLTEVAKVGELPSSVPRQSGSYFGISQNYAPGRTILGDPRKGVLLMFWLEGGYKNCGVPDVVVDNGDGTYPASTTGYTFSDNARTTCWVGI